MVLGEGPRYSHEAAGMACHTSGNDIRTRDGSLHQVLSTGARSRRHPHDCLGQGTGRNATRLCPSTGATAASRAFVDKKDGGAVGTLDATRDALLLLSGEIDRRKTVGQTARRDSGRLRAV